MAHKLNAENLKKMGYKEFQNGFSERAYPEYYVTSFQKRFDDEKGKKYFITIHQFKHVYFDEYGYNFQTDCQFTTQDEIPFDANMHYREEMTIELVEKFYEDLWNKMNFKHYETWDEV